MSSGFCQIFLQFCKRRMNSQRTICVDRNSTPKTQILWSPVKWNTCIPQNVLRVHLMDGAGNSITLLVPFKKDNLWLGIFNNRSLLANRRIKTMELPWDERSTFCTQQYGFNLLGLQPLSMSATFQHEIRKWRLNTLQKVKKFRSILIILFSPLQWSSLKKILKTLFEFLKIINIFYR